MNVLDYTERIQELQNFKSSITGKTISSAEDVESFNSIVNGWEGGISESGYSNLVQKSKKIVQSIYSTKEEVLTAIDNRIAFLESEIESQYNDYTYIISGNYDDDPTENNKIKREKINGLSLDSTVRSRLLSRV